MAAILYQLQDKRNGLDTISSQIYELKLNWADHENERSE